ncbi:MAG: hypothetical protein GY932_12310 [Arcobacter sp.]|nr:hypothetical protein [Arcobacter sp.]
MGYKYKLKEIEVGDEEVRDGFLSTVTDIDPQTGGITWDILQIPNLDKLLDESDGLVKTAKGVYVKTKDDKKFLEIYEDSRKLRNTIRTHIRNNYPEEYKRSRGVNEEDIDEATGINGDVIDLNPGNKTKLGNYVKLPHHLAAALLDVADEIMGKEASTIGSQPQIKQALALLKKAAEKAMTGEKSVDEVSTSGAAGAYNTPYAFRLKGQKANDKAYKEIGYKEVKEGIGATLGPGPKASEEGVKDNAYVKQFKYKLVPKNKDGTYVQKGAGMIVKKLY